MEPMQDHTPRGWNILTTNHKTKSQPQEHTTNANRNGAERKEEQNVEHRAKPANEQHEPNKATNPHQQHSGTMDRTTRNTPGIPSNQIQTNPREHKDNSNTNYNLLSQTHKLRLQKTTIHVPNNRMQELRRTRLRPIYLHSPHQQGTPTCHTSR